MKINYKDISLNLEIVRKNNSGNYILFLHGFTGSSEDWDDIAKNVDCRFNTAALDFIGHGKSDSPTDENLYSVESIIEHIDSAVSNIAENKIILAGYSMGGRAALSYANQHQEKLKALVLESATPGITSDTMRAERTNNDENLAKYILDNPIEKFVDFWMNIDILHSQKNMPEEILKLVRENKLKNNPVGLANSLKGFSTGKMPPLFEDLKNIKIKTLLISGELDEKFSSISLHMSKLLPLSENVIIRGAGHNTHLEKPEEFVNSVNNFLKQF
jgi:2-succinyl-6-hydroxy-2,4-cyclohexadiene-1-carboxylate synthase